MLSKNLRSHNFYFLIFILSSSIFISSIKAQNTTWYVTSAGMGNKSGSSWTNASNDLQMVINAAVSGDEVRVGAGEYKARNVPETNEIDTFYGKACYYIVNKNLRLFGGYPSVGGSIRNASLNRTILNADFQTHVLLTINLSAATRIDGFELRGGFANNTIDVLTVAGASISGIQGAGLYNYASSPTISNCVFASNLASREGGGVANFAGSSPSFTDCVFASNRGRGGAGYSTNNSSTTFNNCVFSENST